MKSAMRTAMLLSLFLLASCGPRPDGKTPATDPGKTDATGAAQGAGPSAAPARACATSDDCDAGQVCVDDACAVIVPDGFY